MSVWEQTLIEAIQRAEAVGVDETPHNALALVLIDRRTGKRISYTLSECLAELSTITPSSALN